MRFRITKKEEGRAYAIIVTGIMDDDGAWDILQVAQTLLYMPNCKELLIDLRPAHIDEGVSALNTETLAAFFEEGLLRKNSALIVLFRDSSEIRLYSDQQPLKKTPFSVGQFLTEAKFFGRTKPWPMPEAKKLVH